MKPDEPFIYGGLGLFAVLGTDLAYVMWGRCLIAEFIGNEPLNQFRYLAPMSTGIRCAVVTILATIVARHTFLPLLREPAQISLAAGGFLLGAWWEYRQIGPLCGGPPSVETYDSALSRSRRLTVAASVFVGVTAWIAWRFG